VLFKDSTGDAMTNNLKLPLNVALAFFILAGVSLLPAFAGQSNFKKTHGATTADAGVRANPVLIFDSLSFDDHGNAIAADPGECIDLTVRLRNSGGGTATNVHATLVSNTPGVTVSAASASQNYGSISSTGQSANPFKISILPTFPCGDYAHFTLNVTTNQGNFTIPVSLTVGKTVTPQTFTSTSVPVFVPDADPDGASMPLTVSGVGSFDRMKVSIHLTNTYDADLDISLVGPGGNPTINLSSDNGDDQDNFGTDCAAGANDTTFDDKAQVSIVNGSAPFVGTFKPEQPLSTFSGNPNGTWTLKVVDDLPEDVGNIECWSLSFESYSCTAAGGCVDKKPAFSVPSTTVSGGNGDSDADKNEIFNLAVRIRNDGTDNATNVSATLSTSTSGLTIPTNSANYPDVNTGESKNNLTPFVVQTPIGMECGIELAFTLNVTTDQGTISIPFKLQTGILGAPTTFTATGPVSIPDAGPTVELPLTVSGLTGRIGKVTTSIFIPHGCTQDLDIDLVHPNNTAINLASDNGSCPETSGMNYGTDCPAGANDTTFDDSATTQITTVNEPFVGTFLPEESLSTFNHLSANGSWKLKATDDFVFDVGSIECWTAKISTYQCQDGGASTETFLLFDDFEDGPATSWTVSKGNWTEQNGKLQNAAAAKAVIAAPLPWPPSGMSDCSNCTRELKGIEVAAGTKRKITITAWSADKHNKVDVIFKVDSGGGKMVMKQRSNNAIVAKGKADVPISNDTPFDFAISYDGTKFDITIDGSSVLTVNSNAAPSGNLLITVKNAAAKFQEAEIL
jgi:uncharacterized repeat protein (TIGR01451 family)